MTIIRRHQHQQNRPERKTKDNATSSGFSNNNTRGMITGEKSNSANTQEALGNETTTTTTINLNDSTNDLSTNRVALSFLPLLSLALLAHFHLGLQTIAEDVLIASLRTCVQLSVLAVILTYVFTISSSTTTTTDPNPKQHRPPWYLHPSLGTLSYVFLFMLPLAAYETTARCTLTHPRAYTATLTGLGIGVSLSLSIAVFFVVRPRPLHSPRVVIPLGGMLLSNALSATSLSLSSLLSSLHNHTGGRIDILLAFGATPLEATWDDVSSALGKGLVPHLNSMNVIGLVAIPGMMSGQILAGGSPGRAVRYQIMIMYLVCAANFVSCGVVLGLTVGELFDGRGVFLGGGVLGPNRAMRVSQFLGVGGSSVQSSGLRRKGEEQQQQQSLDGVLGTDGEGFGGGGGGGGGVENGSIYEDASLLSPLEVRAEHVIPMSPPLSSSIHQNNNYDDTDNVLLALQTTATLAQGRRLHINMHLHNGEISCLFGPSGVGKSTLLRALADLTIDDDRKEDDENDNSFGSDGGGGGSWNHGILRLNGIDRHLYEPSEWRHNVLYVPQTTASALEGTPLELLGAIDSLAVRHRHRHRRVETTSGNPKDATTTTTMTTLSQRQQQMLNYLKDWDVVDPERMVERSWGGMSEGESQRVLLAVALASFSGGVLLLDEPTSSLDEGSKNKVEASLRSLVRGEERMGGGVYSQRRAAVLMVTHEEEQAVRLQASRFRLVPRIDTDIGGGNY